MRNPTVAVVTLDVGEGGLAPLRNLLDILTPSAHSIKLIAGYTDRAFPQGNQKIELHPVGKGPSPGANLFTAITKHVLTQLRVCYRVAQLAAGTDIFIFFFGGPLLILSALTAKFLRKHLVTVFPGAPGGVIQFQKTLLALFKMAGFLMKTRAALSDVIVLYSEKLIEQYGLEKHRNKVLIAHERFIDFNKFQVESPLVRRHELVGYIGRLSREKGVHNLMEAIPRTLEMRPVTKFLIGGDGPLRGEVEEYVDTQNLKGEVNFIGWIAHDELSNYLNKLKLLVLPSYVEGLPTIMLEAMACGVPVLATPVGAIPDIIADGETGFIMEHNCPQCIAENIMRALNYSELNAIAKNARALVEREYSYEAAVASYENLFSEPAIETNLK